MRLDLTTNNRGLSPDSIECGSVGHLEILVGIPSIALERSLEDGSKSDSLSGIIIAFLSVDVDHGVNFIINGHASLVGKAVKAYKFIVRVDTTVPEETHDDVCAWHQIRTESYRNPVAERPVS